MLLTGVAVSIARCGREKEINAQVMAMKEELNCTDLTQPFQNVRVGVDILSELQEKLKGTVPAEQLPYDVLAAYNYGLQGAQKNLWAYGVHEYEYNRAILKRAQELKQETKEAKEEKQ